MKRKKHCRSVRNRDTMRDSGAALIMAVGMLAIFVILGTAWFTFASLETLNTRWQGQQLRARHAAAGGVYAAAGELERALASGTVESLVSKERTYQIPLSRPDKDDPNVLEDDSLYATQATVTFVDECARINLNHASTNVLRALLGIDGDTARRIRSSLPNTDETDGASESPRWFLSVDELLTRNYVDASAFQALDRDLLTVYSVYDHDNPREFVNLNTASSKVVQAVLDIDEATAQKVIDARPLSSLDELIQIVNKSPDSFNYKPETAGQLPKALTFESRCYRVISEGALLRLPDETSGQAAARSVARKRVEAVVFVDGEENIEVRYWNELLVGS